MQKLVLFLSMIAGASTTFASNNFFGGFECPDTIKAQISCGDYYTPDAKIPRATNYEGIYVKTDEYKSGDNDTCQYTMNQSSPLEFLFQGQLVQIENREQLRPFLESVPEYDKYNFQGLDEKPKADILNITYYRKSFSTQRVAKVTFEGILEQFRLFTSQFSEISQNLETPFIGHISSFDITTGKSARLVQVGGSYQQSVSRFSLNISGECEVKLSN